MTVNDEHESSWLSVRGVSKRFGGVQALRNVSLDLAKGEVHGLVGANGAGKSTLIRVLAGLVPADDGAIVVDGTSYERLTQGRSKALGFSFIHQELSLVAHFNAVENALLGLPKPKRLGLVSWSAAERQVRAALEPLGGHFSLRQSVATLSVADQWLVVIVRALIAEERLIAMDEPTASLAEEECERLYGIVRRLAADGITVMYVSHKLDEVRSLCNRVTVFRNGETVATVRPAEISRDDLVTLIVGRELTHVSVGKERPAEIAKPLLRVDGMTRMPAVRDVSLSLAPGEILGLAGLVGAGRSELARLIVGADKRESGRIFLDGRELRIHSPHDAMRNLIAYLPEERRSQGLLLTKSVDFNISLASLSALRTVPGLPIIQRSRSRAVSRDLVERLSIRTPSLDTLVGSLSGGNQQKVLVARLVAARCRVLILDEATRGVDVGAREEMYAVMAALAQRGLGVIFISSDLEELVGRCNRIVVMSHGAVVAEVDGAATTKDELTHLSYFVSQEEEQVA
jgi:ABC-type sugar transport system ATPase subunit